MELYIRAIFYEICQVPNEARCDEKGHNTTSFVNLVKFAFERDNVRRKELCDAFANDTKEIEKDCKWVKIAFLVYIINVWIKCPLKGSHMETKNRNFLLLKMTYT